MDRAARNERQREYRRANGNLCTLKYERTKGGKLMRCYRNMESRILGIQSAKHHLYRGKELLSREEFYEWAMASHEFHRLFREWEESGYQMRLAPSVDRIDSQRGYTPDNMQWVTHSENSRRGATSPHRRRPQHMDRGISP